MCLTEPAYRERKWGALPSLRRVLEDKSVPSDYYGLTSADDSFFEAMSRLMEISILAREHRQQIKDLAQAIGREDVQKDLQTLGKALESASYFFHEAIQEIQELESAI